MCLSVETPHTPNPFKEQKAGGALFMLCMPKLLLLDHGPRALERRSFVPVRAIPDEQSPSLTLTSASRYLLPTLSTSTLVCSGEYLFLLSPSFHNLEIQTPLHRIVQFPPFYFFNFISLKFGSRMHYFSRT